MKILNLYAGIGGNRKLWPEGNQITAVELNPEIAAIYKDFFPNDEVIVADAHQYLLEHFREFDFIWSSPPCQSHSGCNYFLKGQGIFRYPDMSLYQEIIFLKYIADKNIKWIVENVKPYYEPLIKPTIKLDRHLFWTNFVIIEKEFDKPEVRHNKVTGKTDRFGINLQGIKMKHRKDQIIRNCVNPELGLYILNCAFNELKQMLVEK